MSNQPTYSPGGGTDKIILAMEPFRKHMTDEGWQLQLGLEFSGYDLWGPRFEKHDCADVAKMLSQTDPGVVIVQDKREWDPAKSGCFDKGVAFRNVEALADRPDVFRVTVCKDAHQSPEYYRRAHDEIGCHAWIIYYDPDMVVKLCPSLRREHLIRTYHCLDSRAVPEFNPERSGCLLSGALCDEVYPLRARLWKDVSQLPETHAHPHPGYGGHGSRTPEYLRLLSRYKVSICTASIYRYALRKLIESTACGCVVITDLREPLPEIDGNLIRVDPGISVGGVADVVRDALDHYDPERQRDFARRAISRYDYCQVGRRLAQGIETLREAYNG